MAKKTQSVIMEDLDNIDAYLSKLVTFFEKNYGGNENKVIGGLFMNLHEIDALKEENMALKEKISHYQDILMETNKVLKEVADEIKNIKGGK